MTDGRQQVVQACSILNDSNLLFDKVSVEGIETASGPDLSNIVNSFLDNIESIPESKEHLIPEFVIDTYNGIVNQTILFKAIDDIPPEIKKISFRRTRFPA